MKTDIILCGVGGQGILSIATIIGEAAMKENLYIKQAEVHGMSQRGGDVQSNLRISSNPIYSDLIALGSADVIISMEPMEALRYLPFLSKDGWIITSSAPFVNIPNYPDMEKLKADYAKLKNVIMIDIEQMAKDNNVPRSANVILLGAAQKALGIEFDKLEAAVSRVFARKGEKIVEQNIKALAIGKEMEMGIPGLPAAEAGVKAQIKALQDGIAHSYPDIQGYPELKKEASRFVKAFIGVDIAPEGCVPVSGSMQGTYASFLTCSQADKKKDTVLFIDPGFPVQKMQLQVMGVKYETFDVYDYRGDKLKGKLESYLEKGNICAIVYSNPNNPAWICLREEELKVIGELATKFDVIVMEDLAYFAMDFRKNLSTPFEPPYQATVARYTDNYILLISGSKAFSYAGERIGVTCISNTLFHRHYPDLANRYEGLPFGLVFSTRMLYALSSGTSHSAQYAMAAMLKAATDGDYDFRKEISVYGERAHKLKEIFCRHNFYVVYDKDLDEPIADGFYFTIGYPGMTSGKLAHELMYYGVSAICLITTGSHQEGLRVCTSFINDNQYDMLEERMSIFEENNPVK